MYRFHRLDLLGFTSVARIMSGVIYSTIFFSLSILLLSKSALLYMHFKIYLVLFLFTNVTLSVTFLGPSCLFGHIYIFLGSLEVISATSSHNGSTDPRPSLGIFS